MSYFVSAWFQGDASLPGMLRLQEDNLWTQGKHLSFPGWQKHVSGVLKKKKYQSLTSKKPRWNTFLLQEGKLRQE